MKDRKKISVVKRKKIYDTRYIYPFVIKSCWLPPIFMITAFQILFFYSIDKGPFTFFQYILFLGKICRKKTVISGRGWIMNIIAFFFLYDIFIFLTSHILFWVFYFHIRSVHCVHLSNIYFLNNLLFDIDIDKNETNCNRT